MVNITNDNFSIRQICESGQCFRLEPLEDTISEGKEQRTSRYTGGCTGKETIRERYALTALGRCLVIEQTGNVVSFGCSEEEFEQLWKNYFDLDEDYAKIIASIDKEDSYLLKAASYGSGIRILHQDLWEMIVSFIISQQNNIKRIRKCIDLLCRKYGEEKYTKSGMVFYTFPGPEALSDALPEDLYACNLGYRSKYIQKTAQAVKDGEVNLEAVLQMDYEAAMAELCRLYGIGVKVANCICLFALHKTEAFPVDTHINKVLKEQYPKGFPFEKYKGYAGTIQQYIFYYDLMKQENLL